MSLGSSARATALLVIAAAVLVGCTARQSTEQYEQRLEQALSVRSKVTDQLDTRSISDPNAFAAASKQVVSALDELDADPPPRAVVDAHDRMVQGLEGLAALLDRMGRCEELTKASEQDARACRQSISQDVYDEIRNDFGEADTIYRQEGFSLPGLGSGEDKADGSDQLGGATDGGDEL
ncbi:MAG: hypothetical protein JWM25_733 [Thermoleophilia bacterium]|nr:hypothetical protein [Thermoleophilia bacterium]MCZ4496150.1 hypothetical protein [Thermoleophilia bacterium]